MTAHPLKFPTPADLPCAAERTATVQRNDLFLAMPWQIRCYGRGRCTVGDGAPKRYNDRDRAAQTASTWIADGISPADQSVSL